MLSGGGSGFPQFHSQRYSAGHHETWPRHHSPHAAAEDRVWSPGAGLQAMARSALKPTETGYRSATSTASHSSGWTERREGVHPTGQDSPFVPGHSPHSAQPPYRRASYSPCSQGYLPEHSGQYQDRPRSSEDLSLPDMFRDSFSCPLCQYSFASDGQLSDHVRTVHKKSICVACMKVFNSFASLCYHRNVKHGHSDHLKCGICGKFFGHKQHMRSHMINVHKDLSNV